MGDWYSVAGSVNPPGQGAGLYQYQNNPVGQGIGVNNLGLDRSVSQPLGPLYGPGQVVVGGQFPYNPNAPQGGLNRRDLLTTSGPVSPVDHDTIVNGLIGNGVYFHGVITLQDLLNVQAATGAPNGG